MSPRLSLLSLATALLALIQSGCSEPSSEAIYATPLQENAQVLYVTPSGNDAAAGTVKEPLATVQAAVSKSSSSQYTIIRLAPGIYREQVRISGQRTAPLILEGARNAKGEWLSIIDGSQQLDPTRWEARPEVGPGVYAYPNPEIAFLLVNQRSVARLDQRALLRRLSEKDPRPKSITEVLAWPEDHKVPYRTRMVPFWDTIGGVFTPSLDGKELWLRLKNGANPSQSVTFAACEGATVTLQDTNHVVLHNLQIRGGRNGVDVIGGSENRIEQCYIPHGRRRINIEKAAATAVVGNRLEMGFYGFQTGAWGMDDGTPDSEINLTAARKGLIYNFFKYWASPVQTSDDVSIAVNGKGETLIQGNYLDGGLIGVGLQSNARVKGNVIRRMSSVGTGIREGAKTVIYDGNLFSDCNINIRLHAMNLGPAREIYIVRNTSILPDNCGSHIFVHNYKEPVQSAPHQIFVCQNTFLGGNRAIRPGPNEDHPGQGLPHFYVLNNRFIGIHQLIGARRLTLQRADMFGVLDYNQIAVGSLTPHLHPVWMGEHNLMENDLAGWKWDELDYTMPANDSAAGRGLDLTKPYVLKGKEHPALSILDSTTTPGAPKPNIANILKHAN